MSHGHIREYVKRVASIEIEIYPEWNLEQPLPRLPVPAVQSTLDKYLSIIKPVVTAQEYAHTKSLVDEFRKEGGLAEKLQEHLKQWAKTKENWVQQWWLDDMYMKIRLPLPVNSNPGMVLPSQSFKTKDDQLRYASRLISGIMDYKTIIDSRGLPIDRARHNEKGQPMCMEQYYRLFNSYRQPGVPKDAHILKEIEQFPETEHIITSYKNQLFVLEVVSSSIRLTEDDVYTQLKRIVKMADEKEETCHPVGILTSADRTVWANCRDELMKDPSNTENLSLIESSIFILCLDKAIIQEQINGVERKSSLRYRDDVCLAHQMLHGQGSKLNSCNRWYDKTMQFIISEDGACGLNYEHSSAEGIAVVQLIEHVHKYMEEVRMRRLPRMKSICELSYPSHLEWNIPIEVSEEIAKAKSRIDRNMTDTVAFTITIRKPHLFSTTSYETPQLKFAELLKYVVDDIELHIIKFTKFGREFPKSHKMSPDSFIQLALQLTYYKIHGHLVSTYESASTRRFHLGRVDNIRANSPVALQWVKAMIGETETTNEEKIQLLEDAMKWQADFMLRTILGHGIDCHLLGLREMAAYLGMETPPVFSDESYKMSNHFSLSTSQVPTSDDSFMLYGPVVEDGYGVCYNPHPNDIRFCITTFRRCFDTRSDFFGMTLESSLLQMRELCVQQAAQKALASSQVNNGVS